MFTKFSCLSTKLSRSTVVPGASSTCKRILTRRSLLSVQEARPAHSSLQDQGRFLSTTATREQETFYDLTRTIGDDHDASMSMSIMDDLCQKHMELPAPEFAMGCSFLHQTALGNLSELKAMVQSKSSSLVNFRDYDRRTALVSAEKPKMDL
jgi:hypothetical protein